jgi:hypothetical protein
MTGQAKDEDPDFDDDFVLEGVDELELEEPAAADAAGTDEGGHAGDAPAQDSDDILFEVPKGPLRRELSGAQFRESGGREWGGASMSAEEIGISLGGHEQAGADPSGVEEVELEADVDQLADVEAEAAGEEQELVETAETFEEATDGAEPFVVVDGDGSEAGAEEDAVPEEWAPPAEEEEVAADAAAPEPVEEEEPAAVSEYQEIDASSRGGTVLTAAARRGGPLRRLAAVAALLLVAGTGVLVWQPDWLGLGGAADEPAVERTPIARPEPGIDVKPPELPVAGKDPVADPGTGPVRDPEPRPEPRDGEPLPDPRPDPVPDPAPGTEPVGDPRTAAVDPALRPLTEIRLGEELRIGERVTTATDAPALPAMVQGMVLGTQALAQLHNGNFFLGTVKAIEPAAMTLRLEKGEVVLDYGDILQLSAIGSQEYQELKKAEKGYVRLNNQNRLVGNILKVGLSDHVILEMKQSRVVIPRAAIEEIGSTVHTGVKLTDDENDEWVRKLVERTLQGDVPAAESPAPVPEKK